MSVFAKARKRTTEEERYELFSDVHRELLIPQLGRAKSHLDKARKKLGLTAFKPSDSSFKDCTLVPILPAKRTRTTSSNTGTETRGDATHEPEVSPLPQPTGKLPPDSEEIFSTGQDATVPLDSTGPVEESPKDEVREVGAESNIHMATTSDEPGPSPPPTPSLVDGASIHSRASEAGTPFTASLQFPKDPKGSLEKNTRRSERGETSRSQHNEQKIPTPSRKSSPKIMDCPAGDVDGVHDKSSEELEQQHKKPAKKSKRAKQRDQLPLIGGQSLRVALKLSRAIQPKEDFPVDVAAEPAYSAVDQPSPGAENALQLTLDPQPAFQPDGQTETMPSPAATHLESDVASPCLRSSQQPLAYPPVFGRSNSAPLAPIFPPSVAPPRGTPMGSGVPPASPPLSPLSNASPATRSHTITSASSIGVSNNLAGGAGPQLKDVHLSATAGSAPTDGHERNIRIPVWAVISFSRAKSFVSYVTYFKSMQGGVYTRAHTVYGYLLGRFPSPRDAWRHDGRLIISHGGGKNIMNEDQAQLDDLAAPAQSKHQLGDDQLETDSSVRGLLTSYRMFRPIVILAEADYEHLQKFNLKRGRAKEANYYVLGHYAIVAAWGMPPFCVTSLNAEREEITSQGETSLYTRWKFAFQWIEQDQGPPWWLQAPGTPLHIPKPPSMVREYESGNRESFDKYGRSPVIRFHCSRIFADGMFQKSYPPAIQAAGSCTQPISKVGSVLPAYPKVYQREWVCLNPDCESFWAFSDELVQQNKLQFDEGFLSLRELPIQLQRIPYSIIPEYPPWEYQANNCSIFNRNFWAGLTVEASRPQIHPSSTLDDPLSWETYGNGRFNPTEISANCRLVTYPGGESRVVVYYQLPSDVGQIVHVLNNPAASKVPNELFEQYQKDACDRDMFQRHAIKTYVAEAVSTPFEECPDSVKSAVKHITYLCGGVLEGTTEFNELLSVAYAEGQEMNFHSDDEPGLGSVVAGLTLGSSAEMVFRHNIAIKKNLIYKNGPYRASESRTGQIIALGKNRWLTPSPPQGDLLIMNGTEIQKQFEHAVFIRDSDLLRFAATARHIDATNVNNTGTSPSGSQPPK
ncbi:hypothetical protein FRC10_000879 [Ceratobasidium sp. 414]|nr:hypothetical protein FRC10_000879 [Ceratobasidium sp. 414]